MKSIPELPEESVEPLYDMAQSAVRFCLLRTAIDFHVHDSFDKPETAHAFSDRINGDSELIEKFLNAVVAMGLLIREDSLYANSPVASAYLVSKRPLFQGGMLKEMGRNLTMQWGNLGRCLKQGPVPTDWRNSWPPRQCP